jgi:hypothetical protein
MLDAGAVLKPLFDRLLSRFHLGFELMEPPAKRNEHREFGLGNDFRCGDNLRTYNEWNSFSLVSRPYIGAPQILTDEVCRLSQSRLIVVMLAWVLSGELPWLARLIRRLVPAVSGVCFWQFGAPVQNFQVAVIREEAMALPAGGFANHAEPHHVLQSLRHSRRRERELFGCCGDCDDRLALKV